MARPSRTRGRPKPRHLKSTPPSVTRPQLTPDEVNQLAAAMRQAYKWDSDPKDFQLEAVKAQIEGVDMIVQAPTGAGKTALAAGPHLYRASERRFTLMVCPLLSLEEEMEKTFESDFGLKAVALNSKNGACSPETIRRILDLEYQVIIVSPEMLQSRTFINRVLRHSAFMRNIISMFIDEAYCIVHWGADFRKKYGTLGKIRAFLPRGTPVIAVTATLTARVRRSIYASLHFAQSEKRSRFINKGNDRSNVSIVVRACEHPLNSYADLDFLIPTNVRAASDIPKTYLYVDNIAVGGEIMDYLNAKLADQRTRTADTPASLPHGLVRPFNATLSQEYRTIAMARFRAGDIRVLVCTDAAGMGCNIPDVDVVVQWKLPATFSNFIQRAGRAARGRNRTGLAVLLVEKSAYGTDLVSQAATSTGPKEAKKKKNEASVDVVKGDPKATREYARAHGVDRGGSKQVDTLPHGIQPQLNPEAADEGLLTFVQSTTCRRKVWAAAFESFTQDTSVPCCDLCDPTLLNRTRPKVRSSQSSTKNPKRGLPDPDAQEKLREWRMATYTRDFPLAQFDETAILDDDLIRTLVSCGPLSPEQISKALEDKWIFWHQYNEDLTQYVQSLNITFKSIPTKPRTRKRNTSTIDASTPDGAKRPRHVERPESAHVPLANARPSRPLTSAPVVHGWPASTAASSVPPPRPLSSHPLSSYSRPQQPPTLPSYMLGPSLSGLVQPTPSVVARGHLSASVPAAVQPSPAMQSTDPLLMRELAPRPSLVPSRVQLAHHAYTPPPQYYSTNGSTSSGSGAYMTGMYPHPPQHGQPTVAPPYIAPYPRIHYPPTMSRSSPLPIHSHILAGPVHTAPPPSQPTSGSVPAQPPRLHYHPQFPPY